MKKFLENIYTNAVNLNHKNIFGLYFKKSAFLETGIFFAFLSLFLILNWRLFAIGSDNQLFLYGDNLPILNNLFYIFSHFNFWHPFETLVGQNGMLGGYPMAEPQNSVFYLPITLALLFFKAFNLGAVGLYYELLVLHTVHFLIGVFFIYKISHRFFNLSRLLSFIGGIVYLGLGWNAAWFGTATLSYMIGILPLMFYVFFQHLQIKTLRTYLLYILSMTFFLYAGGIVNFFFYIILNFFLLFTAFVFFQYKQFFSYESNGEIIRYYLLLFIVAPLLSLLAYSVQLFTTFQVSTDIYHASSNYDYLAFFGLHFYDLIGLFIPKFGLLEFGYVANPQIAINFLIANSLYVGFLPVIIAIFGMFAIRSKRISLFVSMLVINLILAFGGAFPLYDATFFFPGNNFFRGHYKYLMLVGIYFSLMIPIVLGYIQSKSFDIEAYKKIIRLIAKYIFVLIIFSLIFSVVAFALKAMQKADPAFPLSYYPIALTFSSYFLRMIVIGIISFFAIKYFVEYHGNVVLAILAFVLFIDTSVNFKYAMYNETTIHDLISTTFFNAPQGKTVVNDIDKYTQLYHIPEIIGTDPFFQYSAIPNKYLVEYNNHLKDSSGGFSKEILRAAGIDGILTNKIINDPDFELVSSKAVDIDNYTRLYLYNYNGDIHNDWGKDYTFSTGIIHYYAMQGVKKSYFTTQYSEKTKDGDLFEKMIENDFVATEPVLLVNKKSKNNQVREKYISDVSFVDDTPTYKKIALNNQIDKGLFFINIPYSSIWKAKVNGTDAEIYRANYAFSGVKINENNAVVEMYIDTTKHMIFLGVSLSMIMFFVVLLVFPCARPRLLSKIKIGV